MNSIKNEFIKYFTFIKVVGDDYFYIIKWYNNLKYI